MIRPLVKYLSSRTCVITFHFASLGPRIASVMNFVRMSVSVSSFLFSTIVASDDSGNFSDVERKKLCAAVSVINYSGQGGSLIVFIIVKRLGLRYAASFYS